MKVLVINGSPKGTQSNTMVLTRAFIEGLQRGCACEVTYFNVYQQKTLHDCTGCYTCWTKTPGKCVFDDDMPLAEYIAADMIIWSFPLYYFSMPSKVKCVMDRLLPLNTPIIQEREGGGNAHPSRYDLTHQKYVLISTCGFSATTNNYEALLKQFELVYHGKCSTIVCPEGELFRVEQVAPRCAEYLTHVSAAGYEIAVNSVISEETRGKLGEKLFSTESFMEMANADWEIAGDESRGSKGMRLLRQMAAVYNPEFYTHDLCIQIEFSDLAEKYQLFVTESKCVVKDSEFSDSPNTTITTTYEVWKGISDSKLDGTQAMMEGLYTVEGDFKVMLEMGRIFSTKREDFDTVSGKKTDMKPLLIPFIVLWCVLPISEFWGGVAGIIGSLLSLLLLFKYKFTGYDYCSILAALIIGGLGISGVNDMLLPLSYVVFGLIWGVSCVLPLPLTAYYSVNELGVEYLDNPIFIQTNRIITSVWTVAYFIAAFAMYFLLGSTLKLYSGVLIYPLFGLLGFFTKWFKDYYPARVARGK